MARKLMRLTIRFSPRTHGLVKREAELEGVTITQYVREAALARAYYAIGQRGEEHGHEDLIAQAREDLREHDGRRRPPDDEGTPDG